MNRDLDSLKEQYEKLGKEIKNLEAQPNEYALDKLPVGTLVCYWDIAFNPKRIQILEGRAPNERYPYKLDSSPWRHIKPAPHPWIGYKPGTEDDNTLPPIHKGQLVQIYTRGGSTSKPLPAGRFGWSWLGLDGDIVAYRVVTTKEQTHE
jgi:hypothetical protein